MASTRSRPSTKLASAKSASRTIGSKRPVATKVAAAPAKKSARSSKPVDSADASKPKHKLVRDSFTIPKNEYVVLQELKQRAVTLAHPAKKGELLRAGIRGLSALSDKAFLVALAAVPSLKTGRPKKTHPAESKP